MTKYIQTGDEQRAEAKAAGIANFTWFMEEAEALAGPGFADVEFSDWEDAYDNDYTPDEAVTVLVRGESLDQS